MGKQGPCYHCGVTSTPLWRNGPPDKPVLCNACGSRWRTKGTLANYTPLHARAEADDYEDHRVSRMKSISINKSKEFKMAKRKQNCDNIISAGGIPDYNQGFRKVTDEDTSNRSSSGSAISNSESYAQFGSGDASDLTGPAHSMVWDTMVPSRKRTCVSRAKPSPVEKLTKDLYTILHEQQSSYFSGSSEEDLLFESETPMVSVEIGHGSVLIRHPSSVARDEESEASSLSVDNKQCPTSEVYSYHANHPVYHDSNGVNFPIPEIEKIWNPSGPGMQNKQPLRDKSFYEKAQILGNYNSPLRHIDLNDIVNYEEFMRHLTNEEQQQLLKCLPLVDTVKQPDSLKSMFSSSQFKENFTYFQRLLEEGVLDITFSGAKPEDCKTLKKLALTNLSKSRWVERYTLLKRCKESAGRSVLRSASSASSNVHNMKRLRDIQNQNFPDIKATMKSPKRVMMKASYESKEGVEDGSCFSPKSLFALPADGSSLMLESFNFAEESSDQELLLEVPSNGSFAQAELLDPALSYGAQASTSSSSLYPRLAHP